jgi:integrase
MATIIKRGDRYNVRVRRLGFAPVSRSFDTLADAKEWARLKEREADRGELGPDPKALQSITLRQLVERYQKDVIPKLRSSKKEAYIVNAFLKHDICDKPLSSLTTADFARYRDKQLEKVTAKSLSRMLSPINHMFHVARDEWDVPLRENPLDKLKLKVIDNKRTRRLQAGELERLLAAGTDRSRSPYTILIVRFALETAMRRGEILSLRWSDIDMERSLATVRESKNGHSRVIPLPPAAKAILDEAKAIAEHRKKTSASVFPVSINAFRLSWQRLVNSTKIENLHFHDLRHEAISRLFELGLTVPEVAQISGHRTLGMLMRYAHANNTAVRAKLGIGELPAD